MELKPCPFCGGGAEMTDASYLEETDRACVRCRSCLAALVGRPAGSRRAARESVAAVWNRLHGATCHPVPQSVGTTHWLACSACEGAIDGWDTYCKHCGARIVRED